MYREYFVKFNFYFISNNFNLYIIRLELSTKNMEISMLQNEIDKYEKKLSNVIKTSLKKDKEIYHLNIEIENFKSILEKEKASFNVSKKQIRDLH